MFKKCLAEGLGTCFIVMAGCGAICVRHVYDLSISYAGIACAFGVSVMVMIYVFGHISGAHFNPAVTFAFCMKRYLPRTEMLPFITAQCAGSVVGCLVLRSLFACKGLNADSDILNFTVTQPASGSVWLAFWCETGLTFYLMLVIMSVATNGGRMSHMSGLLIGATVGLGALVAGNISGASMNPARSLGPAWVTGEWTHITAYVGGPVSGALLAAYVYDFISGVVPVK